jgi:phospholipid N-methyltransferase
MNMCFNAFKYPLFGEALKQILIPLHKPTPLSLPKDIITVAVHVRKGSANDRVRSVQYNDEWDEILKKRRKMDSAIVGNETDLFFPLKLPPEQFYVDQIIKLSELMDNALLYVYVFTDARDPQQVLEHLQKHIQRPNVMLFLTRTTSYNQYNANDLIDDIHIMASCDCLIRPDSGFSVIAQLIGNHRVVIYPQDFLIQADTYDLNQAMIIITETGIVFMDRDTQTQFYTSFNEIKREHKAAVITCLFNKIHPKALSLEDWLTITCRKGNLIFDIEAGEGIKTNYYLQRGARVICIESQPHFLCKLKQHMKVYKRCIIVDKAVASYQGFITIPSMHANNKLSFVTETVTLDALIQQYGLPYFCSINSVGFIAQVLSGLSHKIPCLSCSFLSSMLDDIYQSIAMLEKLGYRRFNAACQGKMIFVLDEWTNAESIIKLIETYSQTHPDGLGDIYAQ